MRYRHSHHAYRIICRAVLRDEDRYINPDAFSPERFLTPEGKLNKEMSDPIEGFGYGRRICPGRYFSYQMLLLSMAHILATFKIERAVDDDGHIVEPMLKFAPGAIR